MKKNKASLLRLRDFRATDVHRGSRVICTKSSTPAYTVGKEYAVLNGDEVSCTLTTNAASQAWLVSYLAESKGGTNFKVKV